MEKKPFHVCTVEETMEMTGSTKEGLSMASVASKRQQFGANKLEEGKKKTLLMRLLEQFASVMIIILVVAAVISIFMGEVADASIILGVVILNAVMGVMQEARAEKALDALKKMSAPFVRVKRDGQTEEIKTEDLVPGDYVLLDAGDIVPADLRLIESASMKVEEAALTGESVPVDKKTLPLEKVDAVLGDRTNMAYASCSVTYGRGAGIVVAIGMNTEVGKIAGHLAETGSTTTPLQRKLAELGKVLTFGILALAAVIFAVGLLNKREVFEMFLTAVSLAVAAIPEGLPAVVTIVLALGVQKMAKKNAIIRKLSAVETLGSTQIICSDKTGTLTQNKMTVKKIYLLGELHTAEDFTVTGDDGALMLDGMVLCNDSRATKDENGVASWLGDPTETALVVFAADKAVYKTEREKLHGRVSEIPFDSDRKLMTTFHPYKGKFIAMTKGAPDELIALCTEVQAGNAVHPADETVKKKILGANQEMAKNALRVLAVAYKFYDRVPDEPTPEACEQTLCFVGLVGMIDPPRPEVVLAVQTCHAAGIRPIMITGDHRDTAAAIAREIGILPPLEKGASDAEISVGADAKGTTKSTNVSASGKATGNTAASTPQAYKTGIITGAELSEIPDDIFERTVADYSVYARVSPEHKVRIVKAWKKTGKVVAMTGDGVNDAPALKASDIGVGMGITGTEVSKGVSDMVLSDDNFATIVVAVEEGRKVYGNIQKAIQFLLSSNLGEVVTLFLATLFNWRILFPIHILWVNLVTDTLPALALGTEPSHRGVMEQAPRDPKESFFAGGVGGSILYQGLIEGLLTLLAFFVGKTWSAETGTTMAFAALALIQLAHSMNARSATESIFTIGVLKNKKLLWAILIAALLQVSVIAIPGLNTIFRVVHLSILQWLIVTGISIAIIPIVETVKVFLRLRVKAKAKTHARPGVEI